MAELQRRGVLSAVICSDAFVPLGRAQSTVFHAPQLPLIVIKHPLGGISLEEVKARSAQALPQLIALLRKYSHG